MKRYFYILIAACLFVSCNNDSLFDEHWGDVRAEFGETNLSFVEVMSAADYWTYSPIDVYYYTEPNGKGKSYYSKDIPTGGSTCDIALLLNNLRFYYSAPATTRYYRDYSCSVEGDKILFNKVVLTGFNPIVTGEERECYYKILDYDETKILVETNSLFTERDGVKYSYAIMLLHKGTPKDLNWRDSYVSYEEYREIERKKEQEFWESLTPEYLEDYIADRIEMGYTIKWLEEYFNYICPELYESTIKYILEKYK